MDGRRGVAGGVREVWVWVDGGLFHEQLLRSGLFGPWDALAVVCALRDGGLRVLLCGWIW